MARNINMTSGEAAGLAAGALKAAQGQEDGSVVKEAAKSVAADQAVKAAAAKGLPLAGVEDVLAKPTSVKAWTVAGARTAVAAGLTYFTGGFGKWIEAAIHRIGYKRLLVGTLVTFLVTMTVATYMIFSVVAAVSETVTKPVSVIWSIIEDIPGFSKDDDSLTEGIPDHMCRLPPEPRAAQTLTTTSSVAPTTEAVPADDPDGSESISVPTSSTPTPDSGFVPEKAIGEGGKLTESATKLMTEVKVHGRGADPLMVETWLLYRMSHSEDDPKVGWDQFGAEYRTAYAYVAHERGATETPPTAAKDSNNLPSDGSEPKGLSNKRTDITPMELVMSMDPTPYYDPFQLAAATITSYLVLEPGFLSQTDDQVSAVIGRMNALCGV